MSQDKPVLTVKELCRIKADGPMALTFASWHDLCDLALSALDRQGWISVPVWEIDDTISFLRSAYNYMPGPRKAADILERIRASVHPAPQINEPPQVGQGDQTSQGLSPVGPASGSPDVVERLEAQFYAGNDQIVLRDDCIRALRALEADRSVLRQQLGDSEKSSARDRLRLGDIKKVCESLQSELDRVRKALEEFVRIDEEEGGLYAKDTATSDLVLALDAAKKALPTLGERG